MRKNKIEGVKPFNDFNYKSCYYHQLISGLACFGIDKETVLVNSFVFIGENFHTSNAGLFDDKTLAKHIGYRNIKCNTNRKKLIRCVDKGCPIIVGVDTYYLSSRPEYYHKTHTPHFILVYGYDLDSDELNIVDNSSANSFQYCEKVVSFENVIEANKMFNNGIHNRKFTCHILKRAKPTANFNIWEHINQNWATANKFNSRQNLNELTGLITSDVEGLEKKASKITQYLQALKTQYFILSKTKMFSENPEKSTAIAILISAYSNLLSLFWKMDAQQNFAYAQKKQDSIIRKIEEIKVYEAEVYDYLLEVRQ